MILNGFEHFDEQIAPILLDQEKTLIDRFYLSGKALIDFAIKNPNLYRLLFGKKYAHIRQELVSIKDEDCSGFGALKQAIEEGQESKIIKKEESYQHAIVVWASLHGLASLIIDGFMDVKDIYHDIYDKMFETLLAGLVANKVKVISTIPFIKNILKPHSV